MKKRTLLLILSLSCGVLTAQNLVLNPGLENYITCPGFGQFSSTYINDWSKPSIASTDYYNNNCAGIQPTAQVPHSGDAYFGIIAYNYTGEYREYATGRLSSPLIAGIPYSVSFYVSLNDGYIQAINEIGAYFSSTAPGPFSNVLHIAVTPQIENTSGVLSSTTSWMLVSGSFIATGGEQYITIGNFHDDASTTVTLVGSTGSFGAYYFVDDISVKAEVAGIESLKAEEVNIFPNPVQDKLNVVIPVAASAELIIYDVCNRIVVRQALANETPINLSQMAAGIYAYEIRDGSRLVTHGRIVKE